MDRTRFKKYSIHPQHKKMFNTALIVGAVIGISIWFSAYVLISLAISLWKKAS